MMISASAAPYDVLRGLAKVLDDELTRDRANWQVVATTREYQPDLDFTFIACVDARGLAKGGDVLANSTASLTKGSSEQILGITFAAIEAPIVRGAVSTGPSRDRSPPWIIFPASLFSPDNQSFFRTGHASHPRLNEKVKRGAAAARVYGKPAVGWTLAYNIPVFGWALAITEILAIAERKSNGFSSKGATQMGQSFKERSERFMPRALNLGMDGLRPWNPTR